MAARRRLGTSALAGAALGMCGLGADCRAIELARDGKIITLSGSIKIGDGKVFRAYVEREYKPVGDAGDMPGNSWSVAFNSPGGSLAEGIEIGRAIHALGLVSILRKDDVCFSACAIAFLGGADFQDTVQFKSALEPNRKMQVGATLGFHGYRLEDDKVVIANEAFDQARALTGVVLEYAAEMKEIDLGFLAELMNVSASGMYLINTPTALRKLGIKLEPPLPTKPPAAGYNICIRAERKLPLDEVSAERLERTPTAIGNAAQLLKRLVDDLLWDDEDGAKSLRRKSIAALPVEQALDLLVGRNVDIDAVDWPVERYRVGKDSGFYSAPCYVFFQSDNTRATSVIVRGQSYWVYERFEAVDFFAPDEPLWK